MKKSILIAEDSITSRMLLKNILEAAGYSVTATVDGQDALTSLKNNPVDLVVSDVEMPRMNGFELTSQIRRDERLKDIPLVLVTSLSSAEDKERGVEAGATAYIVKSSFNQTNLVEVSRTTSLISSLINSAFKMPNTIILKSTILIISFSSTIQLLKSRPSLHG